MSKFTNVAGCLLLIVLAAGMVPAAPSHSWDLVQAGATLHDADGNTLPGTYTTWDLMATTGTNWAMAEMIAHADSPGTFYNHALGSFGGYRAPDPSLFGSHPDLEFDTYITAPPGEYPDNVSSKTPTDLAFELGLPVVPTKTIDDQTIAINWAVSGGEYFYGPGTHMIARITVRDGFTGSWDLIMWETDTPAPDNRTGIIHGVFPIPEPATFVLLALSGLALLKRQR